MIKGQVIFQCNKDLIVKRLDIGTYSVFSLSQSIDPVKVGSLVWIKDDFDDLNTPLVQDVSCELNRFNKRGI